MGGAISGYVLDPPTVWLTPARHRQWIVDPFVDQFRDQFRDRLRRSQPGAQTCETQAVDQVVDQIWDRCREAPSLKLRLARHRLWIS